MPQLYGEYFGQQNSHEKKKSIYIYIYILTNILQNFELKKQQKTTQPYINKQTKN